MKNMAIASMMAFDGFFHTHLSGSRIVISIVVGFLTLFYSCSGLLVWINLFSGGRIGTDYPMFLYRSGLKRGYSGASFKWMFSVSHLR